MRAPLLSVIGLATALAGCSDTTGLDTPQPGTPQLSLSFSTGASGGPATGARFHVAAADTLRDGQNTLVVTTAEVVLREIELKRIEIVDCDVEPEPDACEEFEIGPILVDLPLDGSTAVELTVPIDTGVYDEIEFEIHKISDDPEDAQFRAAHPDLVGTSIRVRGMFNGEPFSFETDLDVEQEFDLIPPLAITEMSTTTNVTVQLDISQWFVDASGVLVDPGSANKGGVNESLVKENIKQSVEAFEDEDRDGDDDHS